MRAIDEIKLENMEAAFPPVFYRRAVNFAAQLEALQEVVAADYTAEIERRLAILRKAYPRHTFDWSNINGSAYVHCVSPRAGHMKGLYERGFLREPFLRCEVQMKGHATYERRITPARRRALLILWQQVEAILALHLDADETFNIAI